MRGRESDRQQRRPIQQSDFVTMVGCPGVWKVAWCRHGYARIIPSSVTIADRPHRTVEHGQLIHHVVDDDVL
jgi:hypothetical protein